MTPAAERHEVAGNVRQSSRWHRHLVDRRPRWAPTWKGWLLLLGLAAVAAVVLFRGIHPFLALHAPAKAADTLVIEGWIPEYALPECARLIRSGRYARVITVGGPVTGAASPAATDDTHAWVAFRALRKMGIDPARVIVLPSPRRERDRTFNCALELRNWLAAQQIRPAGVDVVTIGAHSRRSRLLFQRALGDASSVGVICVRNEEYDAARWWRYSEGIREVISESAAYLHARSRLAE